MAKLENIIEQKLSMDQIRDQRIRIAMSRAEFMTEMPRFYKAFDYVDMLQDEKIETLYVSPQYDSETKQLNGFHDMGWSAKFSTQLSDTQVIGVQMHELLHIILGHTTQRCPTYKSKTIDKTGHAQLDPNSDAFKSDMVLMELWNIATDLSINCLIKKYLKDSKSKWNGGLYPGEGPFAKYPEFKTAEWYFEELKKEHQQAMNDLGKALKDLKKQFGEGKIGDHGEWVDTDTKGKVTGGKGKPVEKKDKPDDGEPEPSNVTINEIEKELEEIADDLGIGGKQAGSSGGTTKYADLSKGKEKKTPGWMKKTTHASTHGFEVMPVATRKVPNRRFGIVFPGKKRNIHRNKCLIAVDVSGSIDSGLLNKFTEHLNRMKKYADFDLFFFNHSIITVSGTEVGPEQAEKALCKWKKGMEFYIGGGTSFEPLFKFWNRVRVKYDSFFIFTDGCASYTTPPTRQKEVNWILYGSPYNIRHGNKYDITESEGK